mmetsp:Transcript_35069/g.69092  ORF Transcript_35069/g.69092 Transcript_35069/m.69092 type:complete len:221 (-) Transcript_35069:103-765(-)
MFLARDTSSSVASRVAARYHCSAKIRTRSPARAGPWTGRALPAMPRRPWSSWIAVVASADSAQWCRLSTSRYRREYMPLPGPPAEKDEPPPSSCWRTHAAMRRGLCHPPARGKERDTCVGSGTGAGSAGGGTDRRIRPPVYTAGRRGVVAVVLAVSVWKYRRASRTISSWSAPAAATTMFSGAAARSTNFRSAAGVSAAAAAGSHRCGHPSPCSSPSTFP